MVCEVEQLGSPEMSFCQMEYLSFQLRQWYWGLKPCETIGETFCIVVQFHSWIMFADCI